MNVEYRCVYEPVKNAGQAPKNCVGISHIAFLVRVFELIS